MTDIERRYYEQESLWGTVAPYQRNVLSDIIATIPRDVRSVLDVGCGDGFVVNALSGAYDCTGVDVSETALASVRCRKLKASATSLPFTQGSFDLVMINDVLEHLVPSDLKSALSELARVAGRHVLVSVPFMENLDAGMTYCTACGNAYHITHHVNAFGVRELSSLFDGLGFRPVCFVYSGDDHLTGDLVQYEVRARLGLYTQWDKAMCPVCGAKASSARYGAEDVAPYYEGISDLPKFFPLGLPTRNECVVLFSRTATDGADEGVKRSGDGFAFVDGGVRHVLPRANEVPTWFNPHQVGRLSAVHTPDDLVLKLVLSKQAAERKRIEAVESRISGVENAADGDRTAFAARLTAGEERILAAEQRLAQAENAERGLSELGRSVESHVTDIESHVHEVDNHVQGLRDESAAIFEGLRTRINGLEAANEALRREVALLSTQGKSKMFKFIASFRNGWKEYADGVRRQAQPDQLGTQQGDGKRHFCVICHDQDLDRRIVQQVECLVKKGWSGVIVCLSFDAEDHLEARSGYLLHRIGLKHIIPPCRCYWIYQKLVYATSRLLSGHETWKQRFFRFDWWLYKVLLRAHYRCGPIKHPLPFDAAFTAAACHYPADLVLAEDLPALKAGALLKRQWNCRLIFDSHEFYPEQRVFSRVQKRIMHGTARQFLPDCDAVITVSDGIADLFHKFYGIDRPHVLHNVTDMETVPNGRLFHAKFGIPADHRVILYQGGMVPDRNIENLVSGFVRLNPETAHLVLMGPSSSDYLASLKARAGKLLDRTVHFMDAVPRAELLKWTTSADFGVIPYRVIDLNTKYCMPNKSFEFIQATLPILSNDLVEIEKLLSKIGGGGMNANLNSPQKVAKALSAMLKRDLAADRRALQVAKPALSWDAESKEFRRIVEQALIVRENEQRKSMNKVCATFMLGLLSAFALLYSGCGKSAPSPQHELYAISESEWVCAGYGVTNSLDGCATNNYTAYDRHDGETTFLLGIRPATTECSIRLTFESSENYATDWCASFLAEDGTVLCERRRQNAWGQEQVVSARSSREISRVRFSFSGYHGQPRLLLRDVRLVEFSDQDEGRWPPAGYAPVDYSTCRRLPLVASSSNAVLNAVSIARLTDRYLVFAIYRVLTLFDRETGVVSALTPDFTPLDPNGRPGGYNPTGVCIDASGRLYVANYNCDNVLSGRVDTERLKVVFDREYRDDSCESPENVDVDTDQNLLVCANYDSGTVTAFSLAEGRFLWTVALPQAHGVKILGDKVYATGLVNREIAVFRAKDGKFLQRRGKLGWNPMAGEFIWPVGIDAIDAETLIVSDAQSGFISLVDSRTLKTRKFFGGNGMDCRLFNYPYVATVIDDEIFIGNANRTAITVLDKTTLKAKVLFDVSSAALPSDLAAEPFGRGWRDYVNRLGAVEMLGELWHPGFCHLHSSSGTRQFVLPDVYTWLLPFRYVYFVQARRVEDMTMLFSSTSRYCFVVVDGDKDVPPSVFSVSIPLDSWLGKDDLRSGDESVSFESILSDVRRRHAAFKAMRSKRGLLTPHDVYELSRPVQKSEEKFLKGFEKVFSTPAGRAFKWTFDRYGQADTGRVCQAAQRYYQSISGEPYVHLDEYLIVGMLTGVREQKIRPDKIVSAGVIYENAPGCHYDAGVVALATATLNDYTAASTLKDSSVLFARADGRVDKLKSIDLIWYSQAEVPQSLSILGVDAVGTESVILVVSKVDAVCRNGYWTSRLDIPDAGAFERFRVRIDRGGGQNRLLLRELRPEFAQAANQNGEFRFEQLVKDVSLMKPYGEGCLLYDGVRLNDQLARQERSDSWHCANYAVAFASRLPDPAAARLYSLSQPTLAVDHTIVEVNEGGHAVTYDPTQACAYRASVADLTAGRFDYDRDTRWFRPKDSTMALYSGPEFFYGAKCLQEAAITDGVIRVWLKTTPAANAFPRPVYLTECVDSSLAKPYGAGVPVPRNFPIEKVRARMSDAKSWQCGNFAVDFVLRLPPGTNARIVDVFQPATPAAHSVVEVVEPSGRTVVYDPTLGCAYCASLDDLRSGNGCRPGMMFRGREVNPLFKAYEGQRFFVRSIERCAYRIRGDVIVFDAEK